MPETSLTLNILNIIIISQKKVQASQECLWKVFYSFVQQVLLGFGLWSFLAIFGYFLKYVIKKINEEAKRKPISMTPTLFSPGALLQLQNFAKVAFFEVGTLSSSAKSNTSVF